MENVADPIAAVDDPVVEVRDANIAFDMDRGRSVVLDSASLGIEREEILGIVGESGSGKSMFASALLDAVVDPGLLTGEVIYRPTEDEEINILDLTDKELKRVRWEEISMVMQAAQSGFNPTMSIREHFEETILAHGADLEEQMEYARQLLSDMYLQPDTVMGSYPYELSGGMKQRALIALGLVLDPEVLIFDEPTAALDLLMQRSIVSLLKDMQEKYGWTMLFITHDLPLISDIADYIGVMYAFEIIELGPTLELLDNAAHPYTRALLKAVPSISADYDAMTPISGKSPDPVNVPRGCSYHTRCPIAEENCTSSDPGFHAVSVAHEAKCFYWENSEEAIPYDSSNETPYDEDSTNQQ